MLKGRTLNRLLRCATTQSSLFKFLPYATLTDQVRILIRFLNDFFSHYFHVSLDRLSSLIQSKSEPNDSP